MNQSVESKLLQQRLDPWVIVASLAVIPVVLIELFSDSRTLLLVAALVNWLSWSVFALEAAVMIRSAGWGWVKDNKLPALVTMLTVPVTPPVASLARILRLVRLLRLLPGLQSARRLFSLEGLRYAALVSGGLIIFSGLLFAELEAEQNLEPLEGVWWAMTTVTTVGYGDLYPTTFAGRMLATGLMILGIGFVALVTGFIAERFLSAETETIRSSDLEVSARLDEISVKLDQLQSQITEFQARDQQ